jgi:hypothetical protein
MGKSGKFWAARARASVFARSHHYIICKMAEIPDAEVIGTGAGIVNEAVVDGGARAEEVVAPLEGDAAIAQEQELADKRTPSVKEDCSLVDLSVQQRLERQPPVEVTHANGKILDEPNTLHFGKIVGGYYMLYEPTLVPKPDGSEDEALDVTIYEGIAACPRVSTVRS